MTTFSSYVHALSSQATTDSSIATSDPTLIAVWIGVGILGLIAGVVTVTIAERRLRSSAAPAGVSAPVTVPESSLVASA